MIDQTILGLEELQLPLINGMPFAPLLLQGVIGKFHLLKPALAAVLLFVGGKMLLIDFVKLPIGVSLGVVAGLIAAGVIASLVVPPRTAAPEPKA